MKEKGNEQSEMKEEKKMIIDIQKHKKEGGISKGKDEIKQEEPNGNV